ncbi:MAG: 2-deoxyribose-5-phosphate aldolase, partial [Caldisericum exile]
MEEISKDYLRSIIDHTLLKPDATPKDIEKLCKEAIENNFFAVCVNSSYVELVKSFLSGSSIKIASVVGFPLG